RKQCTHLPSMVQFSPMPAVVAGDIAPSEQNQNRVVRSVSQSGEVSTRSVSRRLSSPLTISTPKRASSIPSPLDYTLGLANDAKGCERISNGQEHDLPMVRQGRRGCRPLLR